MKRVCKPGGLVAARDGDYGAFRWYPDEPAIDRWLALYRTIARRNAGEPDAGRFLLAWAHAAGFDDVRTGRLRLVLRDARRPRVVGWVVGRSHDRFRDRAPSRSPTASRPRRSCARSPTDGAAGRRTPTPGTLSSTARSSAAPSHHRRSAIIRRAALLPIRTTVTSQLRSAGRNSLPASYNQIAGLCRLSSV